jgi:hypothetical protein
VSCTTHKLILLRTLTTSNELVDTPSPLHTHRFAPNLNGIRIPPTTDLRSPLGTALMLPPRHPTYESNEAFLPKINGAQNPRGFEERAYRQHREYLAQKVAE